MGEEIREAWTKYKASLPIDPEISFFLDVNERIFVIPLLPGTLKNQILITSLMLGGKGLTVRISEPSSETRNEKDGSHVDARDVGTLDPSDQYRKLHQLLSPETNSKRT